MDKSVNRDNLILDSFKDCLADASDLGFSIQSNHYQNTYKVRIINPRALASNRNNRVYPGGLGFLPPNQWGDHFDNNDLQDDLQEMISQINQFGRYGIADDFLTSRSRARELRYDGAKTYEKVRNSLNFLCSYIPDMYELTIKGIRIEFLDPKYNSLVQMDEKLSVDPVYWKKSYSWMSLLEGKSYPGFMNSDIVTIDIQFEREIPIDVHKWMSDFIGDSHVPKKENWIRRIFKKFM